MGHFLSGIAGDLFGGGQGRGYGAMQTQTQAGMNALQQYLQQAMGQLAPFQQAGAGALGPMQHLLSQMSDPTAYYNQVMQGYSQSPAAQQQIQAGTQAAQHAGAATGMLGSGSLQEAIAKQAQDISQADQQRYFQNVTGLGQQLLGGEQGLAGMGAGAAGTGAGILAQGGQALANLYGQLGQEQYGQDVSQGGAMNQLLGQFLPGGGVNQFIGALL